MANEAVRRADTALSQISAHEQVCGERYSNINRQLEEVKRAQHQSATDHHNAVEKVYSSLDSLKATAFKAAGIDAALRYACLVIGAVGIVYGIVR